jgi:transmembrane sensor
MMAAGERAAMGRDRWAEALTWYTTLREADEERLNSGLGRDWEAWYADERNQRIFDDLSRLMADSDCYRKRQRPGKSQVEEDFYDPAVPVAQWRPAQMSSRTGARTRHAGARWGRWIAGGLGVAAALALVALRPPRLDTWDGTSGAATYQTAIGGIRDIHLRDGSSIILGGQTRVAVMFSAQRRSVHLIEGEAWFKVAHDPRWPFVVAAGTGTITAVGTAFLVTRESPRVVVTVTEGTVEVSAHPPTWTPLGLIRRLTLGSMLPSIPVSRGQELAFSDNGALRPVEPADTHAATTWTHGRLTFDDQTLQYVVQTVNRYSSRHIIVGSSAAALRFSGIVFDNDIDDWLKSLKVIFPVTEEDQGASVYIRMREPPPVSH